MNPDSKILKEAELAIRKLGTVVVRIRDLEEKD